MMISLPRARASYHCKTHTWIQTQWTQHQEQRGSHCRSGRRNAWARENFIHEAGVFFSFFSNRSHTHLFTAVEQSLSLRGHVELVSQSQSQLLNSRQFAQFINMHGGAVPIHGTNLNPHDLSADYAYSPRSACFLRDLLLPAARLNKWRQTPSAYYNVKLSRITHIWITKGFACLCSQMETVLTACRIGDIRLLKSLLAHQSPRRADSKARLGVSFAVARAT